MSSKVPQFGAWSGEENYTVYFEKARKSKNNVQKTNPNDSQENPPTIGTPSRAESKDGQAKVPQFGAWDNGDNVGYTEYFEKARKTTNSKAEKPEPQGRSKVPQFGAWNEGQENVEYTAYFEKTRKEDAHGEPQMNRDVVEPARQPPSNKIKDKSEGRGTKEGSGSVVRNTNRDGSETPHGKGRQTPQHPRATKTQLTPSNNGSQNSEKGTSIPQFGVWHNNPQAMNFTGTFLKAVEDRNTPLSKNTPASGHQQTDQAKRTSCFPCFG